MVLVVIWMDGKLETRLAWEMMQVLNIPYMGYLNNGSCDDEPLQIRVIQIMMDITVKMIMKRKRYKIIII